nr:retrovirus-related Pol polyprotein from transposon TNT 1-94 [Tanacetum cinerariifolium]
MLMLTKPQVFYDDTRKQALGYQNLFYLKKAQRIKPTLYDGNVISSQHVVIPVIADEETLILEEAHRKLPKVSLVNTSLKRLKYHLGKFDTVVKKRITPDAITEGSWGFEHTKAIFLNEVIIFLKTLKDIYNVFDKVLNEISEVQIVFNQMEAVIQQCFVDKHCFEIHKKELFLDNDRLLHQIMSQDVMLCVMDSTAIFCDSMYLEMKKNESCNKCLDLEAELVKKKNMVERDVYTELSNKFTRLEKHFIYLELDIQLNQQIFQKDKSCKNHNALEFLEFFENNDLKARLQEKDTTINKLRNHIESLRESGKKDKVKQDMDEIETINIELEHNELLVYVRDTCLTANKPNEKLVVVTPMNKVKKDRITSTKVVPLKETNSHSVKTQKPETKVYSKRPKQAKSVGSSKKAKIVESRVANNSEPNHSWGSNATDVPSSSSLVNDRFKNNQIAKIMGYGDYQLGNVTISRNGAVKRRNRTLVEAARTMLTFSKASLFLWAEAINIACYTQNPSLIRLGYNKTPYELMHDKKPDLSFLYVFGSLCYPTNDSEDLGQLNAKADIGIFVGYAPAKKAFRIYNRRTQKIMETIHVTFDELMAMASEQFSSGPGLQLMTPRTSSSSCQTMFLNNLLIYKLEMIGIVCSNPCLMNNHPPSAISPV